MIYAMTMLLTLVPPEAEIAAWSMLRGVDYRVALAVHQTETGNVRDRDGVVSRSGDYGRMQINCSTWRRLTGNRDCEALHNRHVNILAGVTLLARWQARCKRRSRVCRRPTGTAWVCHYNGGFRCGPMATTYAAKVERRLR